MRKKEGFDGQKAIVLPTQILSKYCEQNEIIRNLYVTDIGYYPKAKFHYRERSQGADQHILIYCGGGSGVAVIKEIEYTIEAGDFFVIPMNTSHTYTADENNPWTIYWIHFKGSSSNLLIELFNKQLNGYKGFIKYNEQSIHLFNEMYNQLERGYGIDNLIYCNMCLGYFLTTMIYNDMHDTRSQLKHKDVLDKAVDFLGDNISEILTLEKMASAVNLSPSYFSFLFKKKTGFSPIEYFNHLKIQKACQYLLFTDLRVREIALELGIDDPYYFTRMFTKVMGLSPNNYREKKIH
ncbi:MAG: AraC family transcriptional regulator [Ginsengibacter sp.]